MRKALILAAGLALIGMPAWSQSSFRDRDDYDRDGWRDGLSQWDGGRDGDRRGRDEQRGRATRDDDRSGRYARFDLRSGDTQLRVVCGDRESMQACVDAALRMFDRVQAQPRAATGSPTSPAPTSPPASR